ncbi:MAG: hypothetical protein H6837_18355 [Planctomycetes bacterium]|nr:hypothetical protein [Planctomycetota bacterium]
MNRRFAISALAVLAWTGSCTFPTAEPSKPQRPPERLLVAIGPDLGLAFDLQARFSGLKRHDPGPNKWEILGWPQMPTNHVTASRDGKWIYASTDQGVFVSRDAGKSFWLTGGIEVHDVQRVCLDPRNPARAFAATARGVFQAPDITAAGNPWQPFKATPAFSFCHQVQVDARHRDKIWAATDRGVFIADTAQLDFRRSGPYLRVRRLLQQPANPALLWAATDGDGVWSTTDHGATWSRLPGSPDTCSALALDPVDPAVLYCGGTGGVWISRDGGASWRVANDGLRSDLQVLDIVFDPDEPRTVHIGTTHGLYSSTSGLLWTRFALESPLVKSVCYAPVPNLPAEPHSNRIGHLDPPRTPRYPARPVADPEYSTRSRTVARAVADEDALEAGRAGLFAQALAQLKEGSPQPELWGRVKASLERRDRRPESRLQAMALFLHCRARMPDPVTHQLASTVTGTPMLRGTGESQWTMYYVSLLLAAQTFPGTAADAWFNGRSTLDNYREAEAWLRQFAAHITKSGAIEFDAPGCLPRFVSALLLLYDFAADGSLQRLAAELIDLLLEDYLGDSLGGAWCGAHAHASPGELFAANSHPVAVYHFLYAGGIAMPPLVAPWAAIAAYSWYQPPAPLRALANDRTRPYVRRETECSHDFLRNCEQRNVAVQRYTYMTRTFGMGSIPGGLVAPFQQHSWGLTWSSKAPRRTLFSVHPYASIDELAKFFPEDPFVMRPLLRDSPYTSRDKLVGGSPFEYIEQDQNTLLALYAFPQTEPTQQASLLMPESLAVEQEGSWIFGRDGDFHVAVFVSRPGAFEPPAGGLRRYRCLGATVGFVVVAESAVVAPPGLEHPRDFAAFRRAIRGAAPPELTHRDGIAVLSFQPPGGQKVLVRAVRTPTR